MNLMLNTKIDISHIPFSRYGAYVSVCRVPGRYELDIHDVRQWHGRDKAFRMFFIDGEIDTRNIDPKDDSFEGLQFEIDVTPALISVKTEKGTAKICLLGDYTLSVTARGVNILLMAQTSYGYGCTSRGGKKYEFIFHNEYRFGIFTVKKGSVRAEGPVSFDENNLGGLPYDERKNTLLIAENGELDAEVMLDTTEKRTDSEIGREEALRQTESEWLAFLAKMTPVPQKHRAFAEASWYNLWSCFVHARDRYPSDAMLMSKNFMSSLWSWDHCFNAIAIAYADPKKALEQFFLPFTQQNTSGVLPDNFNPDMGRNWATTKPPIHGWAFSILMERLDPGESVLRRAYDHLSRLTDYWMEYRDEDEDGVPGYPMGCDSGWDNAMVFTAKGRFIETPDLSALLILQMHCLKRIAEKLGDAEKAGIWEERADKLLCDMLAHFWNGERFVSKVNGTHEEITGTECLINYMPVVLGNLLPKEIAEKNVRMMLERNLTQWGLSTESPSSPYYETDGYFRGPIWAPITYMIIDGLRRMGHEKEAKEIAGRFVDMCAFRAKGNYETFDALTGEGQRAPGYTWTTSVYLELLWQYGADPA